MEGCFLSPNELSNRLREATIDASADSTEIRMVHVAPKTLSTFATALHRGFQMLQQLMVNIKPVVCVDDSSMCPAEFVDSIQEELRGADIVLIEVHGAEQEVRILESVLDYCKEKSNKVMVLIHRPEEFILRIKRERGISTVETHTALAELFNDVHAIILLGKSGIQRYSPICPHKRVTAIFHPYFDARPIPDSPRRYRPDSVVIIGSNTTWGEMRDISDVDSLLASLRVFSDESVKVIGYISGNIQSKHVDVMKYISRQNSTVLFLSNEMIEKAYSEALFIDEDSFREWLYKVSDSGKRLIIRGRVVHTRTEADVISNIICESLPPSTDDLINVWESRLVDFNLQLYRENLRDLRDSNRDMPKEEYSGTLHKGLPEIFVVFESPSMDDVGKDEGLQMLTVSSHDFRNPDFTETSKQIIHLIRTPEERLGILRHNFTIAQRNSPEKAAYGYYILARELEG